MTDGSHAVATPSSPRTAAGAASDQRLRGRLLLRKWTIVVSVAEFLGFAAPAIVGALTVDAAPAISVPAIFAAGALEGAMLGWGQSMVLRQALPELPVRRWIAGTAGAATVAYVCGLGASAVVAAAWPVVVTAVVAALLAVALLASIGGAQWLILRHLLPRVQWWIVTTAAAWLVGLGVFFAFTMPLWQPGQSRVTVIAIGVAGGLLMAITTSVVTGLAACRLTDRSDAESHPPYSRIASPPVRGG